MWPSEAHTGIDAAIQYLWLKSGEGTKVCASLVGRDDSFIQECESEILIGFISQVMLQL
jgi:hypothetical protein